MSGHLASTRLCRTVAAAFLAAGLPALAVAQDTAATLDSIAESGRITLGYIAGAEPFSAAGAGDMPAGYTIDLCGQIVTAIGADLGRGDLAVDWVKIGAGEAIAEAAEAGLVAVAAGDIDLLCTAIGVTASRRAAVSFSLPVFPGGTGVLLRSDSAQALRDILAEEQGRSRPVWRATPARTLIGTKTFAVVSGTIAETWLADRIGTLDLASVTLPVASAADGVAAVLDRQADAFFGQMPLLLDLARRSADPGAFVVLPRHFTHEPLALALPRGDEDFRLVVDRALSATYAAPDFPAIVTTWFGEPDKAITTFFMQTIMPE